MVADGGLRGDTSRIKLGQMCTAMSYRNPVYLAKVAATTDIISGGRIQMGIGGGWYEHEWRAYGYGFPSAGVRLARLDEGVQIMRTAWRDGKVSFDGKHYQVDGAIVAPKPLQPNGIPLWIAGGGEKVTLRIAAQYAQYTNFTPEPEAGSRTSPRSSPSTACKLGTDFEAIVRSANFTAVVGSLSRQWRKTGCSGSAIGWPVTCLRPWRIRWSPASGRIRRRAPRIRSSSGWPGSVTSGATMRSVTSPRPHTNGPGSSCLNGK